MPEFTFEEAAQAPEAPKADAGFSFEEANTPSDETSTLGAFTRSAGTGVLPAAGAGLAGSLGWGAAARLAPRTRGASLLLPLAGSALAAYGGGTGTRLLQEGVVSAVAPEAGQRLQELQQADVAQHPWASVAGRLAASIPTFMADPSNTMKALASIPALIRGTATQPQIQAASGAAIQAGLGGATATVPAITEGRLPTLGEVGEGVAQATLFGRPRGWVPIPRSLQALAETPGTLPPISRRPAERVAPEEPAAPMPAAQPEPAPPTPEPISAGEEIRTGPPPVSTVQEPVPSPARPIAEAPAVAPSPVPPPRTGLLRQVVQAFAPKAQQVLPETPSTAGDWLPDLGDRASNKVIATEPTGIGRIPVLNWLFDPRHRAKTEPEKSIINYFYEQAAGQAHVKALGSTFGTKFKQLFPRNETGEFTTVGRSEDGQSLHPSDVFEELQRFPSAYKLTPEQRQAFDELMRYESRARELEQQYNLRENPETQELEPGGRGDNPYYTRGRVIGQPRQPRGMGGGSMGGRQFFQKARSFESEQQGANSGFNYPMNVDDRILARLSRLYKAIGDRRLAQDEGLGGRWGSDTGPVTYHEGQVFQPGFRRGGEFKIFPAEVARKITKSVDAPQTEWLKALQNVNDASKSIALGFDWGAGQIQGLITAFRDPKAWAKAQGTSLQAFASPDAFSAYVRNNAEATRELAQFGSPVGQLPEMVAGLGEGGLLRRVPGAQRFGRLFQTFLDVAKIEKWKARREVTPREEWPRAIQEIEHELNMGRMESIGVGPAQALAERLLLLAPSYYRGGIGLIGDMMQKGVTGAQARRAMGSYMGGVVATFAAGAVAAGLPWEEIKRRLNPGSGNFLMIPVKMGGKSIEVGFGGIMRSFMRLGGEMLETSVKHPENWGTLATDKNPVTKWLRGHAAPVPSKALDAFSGADYMGEDTDMASLSRGNLPLAVQAWLKREPGQTTGQTAADTLFSFVGLLSWPQSTRNRMLVERNRLAQEKFGNTYENLKIRQQAAVTRTLERDPNFAKNPPTKQQIANAFKLQIERQQAVQAGLDKGIQEVLTEKELRVPGYQPTLKVGPTEVILTDAQQDRYRTLIIEEYNRTLKNKVNILRRRSSLQGQEMLVDWATQAKQRAQRRLQQEFNR
jgi:hypothetical protein